MTAAGRTYPSFGGMSGARPVHGAIEVSIEVKKAPGQLGSVSHIHKSQTVTDNKMFMAINAHAELITSALVFHLNLLCAPPTTLLLETSAARYSSPNKRLQIRFSRLLVCGT